MSSGCQIVRKFLWTAKEPALVLPKTYLAKNKVYMKLLAVKNTFTECSMTLHCTGVSRVPEIVSNAHQIVRKHFYWMCANYFPIDFISPKYRCAHLIRCAPFIRYFRVSSCGHMTSLLITTVDTNIH